MDVHTMWWHYYLWTSRICLWIFECHLLIFSHRSHWNRIVECICRRWCRKYCIDPKCFPHSLHEHLFGSFEWNESICWLRLNIDANVLPHFSQSNTARTLHRRCWLLKWANRFCEVFVVISHSSQLYVDCRCIVRRWIFNPRFVLNVDSHFEQWKSRRIICIDWCSSICCFFANVLSQLSQINDEIVLLLFVICWMRERERSTNLRCKKCTFKKSV